MKVKKERYRTHTADAMDTAMSLGITLTMVVMAREFGFGKNAFCVYRKQRSSFWRRKSVRTVPDTRSSIKTSWIMFWSGCSRRSQKGWNEMEIVWVIGAFVGAAVTALLMACCKAGGGGDR